MATPPLSVKISHSGFYADGRPNVASVLITDIDSGLDEPQTRQAHRTAVYVPVGGSLTLPLTTRVLYSYTSGQIAKFGLAGVLIVELVGGGLAYQRYALPADISRTGAMLGAATETILASSTVLASNIEARRKLHITGWVTTAFNGADTWRIRVRVGGLTGDLVYDSGALVVADGTQHSFEVDAQIRTLGLAGTFNSTVFATHSGALAPTVGFNAPGTVNTTADVPVVITAESSSASGAQVVTLTETVIEVLAA